jgi:hypothetical protein
MDEFISSNFLMSICHGYCLNPIKSYTDDMAYPHEKNLLSDYNIIFCCRCFCCCCEGERPCLYGTAAPNGPNVQTQGDT